MTTMKVSSTVSYGINVQNRYLFLDEDSLTLSATIAAANSNKKPTTHDNKQKSATSKSNNVKANPAASSGAVSNSNKKHNDTQAKASAHAPNGQQAKSGDMRRQPQQQQRDGRPQQAQMNGNQAKNQQANRNRNFNNQDRGHPVANGNQKFPRSNQSAGSHNTQGDNKENHQGSRPMRQNGQRFNPRARPNNDELKSSLQQDGQLGSNDEEKARRQQKRLTNLKFKDPEKRERRQQVATTNLVAGQQQQQNNSKTIEQASEENSTDQHGQRNRRDGAVDKNRARPRRNNQNGEGGAGPAVDGPRRDGPRRDRPNQRQRNGFGGSQSESGVNRQEKPKPVPNFSNKTDFPSLAS